MTDTIALIGGANKVLQDPEVVGNGLKSIAINMAGLKVDARSGEIALNKTAKALKNIAGIEIFEDAAQTEVKDMATLMDEVYQVWGKLDEKNRLALSEAIAGKQQAKVFQGLMAGYQDVIKIKEELNNGDHFGSAFAENAQYVDSLAGKLNALKEVWVGIFQNLFNDSSVKGMLDGLIAISEVISDVMSTLDKFGLASVATFSLISGSMAGLKGMSQVSKAMKDAENASTHLGTSVSKTGAFFKSFIKQGLLTAGVAVGVKVLASAWDYMTNNLSNTAKKLNEVEQEQRTALESNNQKLNILETTGRKYEELASKAKRTAEEESEMLRLGNELAKALPEIQIGTDANGNAIISMTNDMQGYIDTTNEAIKAQERLLLGTNIERSENALKQLTQGEFWDRLKGSGGFNKQALDEQNDFNKAWTDLESKKSQALKAARTYEGKQRQEALNQLAEINNEQLKLEATHSNKLSKINSERLQAAEVFKDTAVSSIKDGADSVREMTPEMEDAMIRFAKSLDFSEIDSEVELAGMQRIFNELPQAVADGSVNIEQLQEDIKGINEEFSKSGNIENYNKSMRDLANTVAKENGWDADVLYEMFTKMDNMFLKSKGTLDDYLSSFGKNMTQLKSGDQIAKALQSQYDSINNHIKGIAEKGGDIRFQKQMIIDLKEDKTLPSQIRDMVSSLEKAGMSDIQVLTIAAEALIDFKDGGFDKNSLESLNQTIQETLGANGMEYDQAVEMSLDIIAMLGSLDKEEVLRQIKENIGEGEPVEKKVEVKTEGEEKLKGLDKALEVLKSRPDVDKKVQAVVDGEEDLILFSEIINKLPLDQTHTNKFIVDNAEALAGMKTYEEVLAWIEKQPKEFKTKYGFEVEGEEKVDSVTSKVDERNGKESKETLDVDVEGEEEVEEVSSELDERNGKETKEKYGVEVDKADYESFKEDFKGNGDGTATLTFVANTAQAAQNISGLKVRYEELKALGGQNHSVTFTANTSQAAKNISGLNIRVKEYKTIASSVKSINFSSNTAQSAQNISGLNRRIMEYQQMAANIKPLVFKSETAQAAKNISGLIAKVNEYNGVTPKVMNFKTNASSIAAQIRNLAAAVRSVPNGKTISYTIKTSGSVPKIATRSLSTVAERIKSQTLGIQRSINDGIGSIGSIGDVNPILDTMPRTPIMSDTPTTYNYSDPMQTQKYGLNHFIELENQLKKIAHQLEIIDIRAEKAIGKEKIEYLNQQIALYKQQQTIQKNLVSDMEKYQASLKNFLSGKGFGFDQDGNITNYHTKLVAMEQEYERLEEAAKKASDASSDYKGDNEGEKDRLSKNAKNAQEKAQEYKKNLDEIKSVMGDYLDVTFNELPNAKEEWEELNNKIKENLDLVEEINRNQRLFEHQNKVQELEYEYDKLADRLSIIDIKMKNAYGKDKLDLMNKQIDLMEKQKNIQQELLTSYENMAKVYREDLSKYGFSFDENGDITNLDETLNKFKNSSDLKKIKDLVEDYLDIQRDKLPDVIEEYEKLESEIKEVYKEQLEITKDIEQKLTNIYKKQIEERKKLIDSELNKRLEALNKQKKAYNDARDEEDYQKDYNKQMSVIQDLQSKIALLSKDTSLGGKKQLQELLDQLEKEQEKLDEMIQDKVDSDTNDKFEEESEKLEEEAEKAKEELDEKFSEDKLQQIVKDALTNGVFTDIDGNIKDLEDTLLDFEDKFGDGMTAIGEVIKSELIANLTIAKDTIKDLNKVLDELDLGKSTFGMSGYSFENISIPTPKSSSSPTVTFNSPLINVEGNVDNKVIGDLKKIGTQLEKQITDNILNAMR